MRKIVLFALIVLLVAVVIPVLSQEVDYSVFFTDDNKGSVFVDVSNQYAKGSVVVHDLMLKKKRWMENNPNKRLVSTAIIRSTTGHTEGFIFHYEITEGVELLNSEADYSIFTKDDGNGSVFIRVNEMENRVIENNFNKPELVNDLFIKKAYWIQNNSDKRIISIDPFYGPSGRIYGLFLHYEKKGGVDEIQGY